MVRHAAWRRISLSDSGYFLIEAQRFFYPEVQKQIQPYPKGYRSAAIFGRGDLME
jgi:hypothetical protein